MLPAGTTLTFDVKGTAGQWIPRTVADVRAGVIDSLTPHAHVYDVSLTRESFLSDPENLYYWAWPYVAVVTLQSRMTYAHSDDLASIVAHAFYSAAGALPTVTARGYGPQQTPDVITGTTVFGSLGLVVVLAVVAAGVWFAGPLVRTAGRA